MRLTATDAARLLRDDAFKAILEEVRSQQVATFVNSVKKDTELREEAHSILRAVDKIEQALQAVITEDAIKQKRKK